ncbi:hypothetical protein [Enterococcus sp. AZ150]|uniref:hypothetical protein n=1 Tax=Enterococcus sp. AZ150 TaxID=2774866 RepID=UPI003F694EC3
MGTLWGIVNSNQHVDAAEMQRLYNPNSGEHFYTANTTEKNNLVSVGWKYEGIGWNAPSQGDPVYRLYNPNAGDHHYTMNGNEKNNLVSVGWKYEGIGWYSDQSKSVPLYRTYNPNAKAGSHHYSKTKSEIDNLTKIGWKYEGISWYGINEQTSPVGKYTVWYTANKESQYDIKMGEKVFDTEEEAIAWIDNYADNLLMQGISASNYGISTWGDHPL